MTPHDEEDYDRIDELAAYLKDKNAEIKERLVKIEERLVRIEEKINELLDIPS